MGTPARFDLKLDSDDKCVFRLKVNADSGSK